MILFENVTKTYPRTKRPALSDISLEIPRGEFAFVVGTSGSGKSTLLQLVLKEQDATAGRILVGGRDLDLLPDRKVPALRREIGCVFQDFRLLPNKTVYQNVAYALQVLGNSRSKIRQTVPETLDLVGLAGKEKRLPHQLSGGEQQRVAIARAFINRPPILLADEPTGNLDPATSLEIVQLLDRINRTGTTVVMATHDTATVDAMRKRVIRLHHGDLVSDEHAGEYTTGSIPRVELEPELPPRPQELPELADGYDDGAVAAPAAEAAEPEADDSDTDDSHDSHDGDDGLPPIGRDADEPRQRAGFFRRRRAVQTTSH